MNADQKRAAAYDVYDAIEYALLMEAVCRHCRKRNADHQAERCPILGGWSMTQFFSLSLPEDEHAK